MFSKVLNISELRFWENSDISIAYSYKHTLGTPSQVDVISHKKDGF